MLLPFKDKKHLFIVNVGAGTGIALEEIVELLGNEHQYHAINVSTDMIKQGRRKFPTVQWYQGRVESLLSQIARSILSLRHRRFSGWIVLSYFGLFQNNFEPMVSWRSFKTIVILRIVNFSLVMRYC